MVIVPNKVLDKRLYLSRKTNALPKFGFLRTIKSRNRSFSYSLESNPNIKSDINDHMHVGVSRSFVLAK